MTKREKMVALPQSVQNETPNVELSKVRPPSELSSELSKVSKTVLLALTPGYSDGYVQDYSEYSTPLSLLYNPNCLEMELLVECESIFEGMSITERQVINVEASTRDQSLKEMVSP